jgi:5-methylcytosine-specific restriction endonuclease McrBC regulatory subunit McrC
MLTIQLGLPEIPKDKKYYDKIKQVKKINNTMERLPQTKTRSESRSGGSTRTQKQVISDQPTRPVKRKNGVTLTRELIVCC